MSIQVTVCPNPFSQERKEFNFEQGLSIQDILKKIDTKHVVNTGWRVLIDDEIITDFTRIPVEGQKVYIKLVPEGDADNQDVGVGMKIGGGLLTAAGIIMMFTPAATLGAAFIGAGIGVFSSGVILYNSDLNITDREKPEQDQSIRGSRNQSRPYGTLPVLFGRRRIYTDVCANPFTWVESDGSVYLYQLFCAGQKDIQIDTNTIKIDETLIKDYSASGDISKILDGTDELIHMSIASGASTSPLYNKCVHEIQLNSILKHETEEGLDGAVIRTTPKDTTSINVDIFFYNGLGKYDDDGDIDDVSVEVIAEYKQADEPDSSYTLLGYFSGSSNVITGHELKTKRCAITKTDLLPESYTVRITRVTNDSTSNRTIDAVYVGSIRAAKNENPVRPERCQQITQIGLKIKASEKLNNIVEQLNFVAESKLPVYKNGNWNTEELSRNPASAAMYAMKSEIAQQQLDNSEIDLDSFANLYTWCKNHGYECNAYVTEDMTIKSLLSNIASTCRAEILRVNGKITVIQDIERSSYVQLFTPRNSFNYKESMLLSDIPDELKIQFVDEDSGYAENEASVYNTPDGNYDTEPETSQNITLWGVTNKDQAIKLGMYNYGTSNHRFLVVKFSCDFEYLMCRKGDWIKFAGDIAIRGLKQGRITSSEGTRLFLDENVTMESGKNYAIRIRTKPGECILRTVQNVPGTSNSVVVNGTALTDVDDCLFTFGISGNDSMDLIVTDIQCGDNLSADITCVEYCPEIFGVDDPDYELPDFVNKLSDVQSVIDPGTVAKWRTYTTYNDSESQPSTPSGDGTSSGWHHQQTENSKWVSTKTSESIEKGEWSAPIPTGKKVMDLLIPEGEITEPDDVRGLQAVAQENGILIKWYPVNNNGLNNTIQQYYVGISKDGGSTWSNLDNTTGTSITYNFQRNVDGYPESNNLSTWKVRVLAENIYGKLSNYTIINVDLASYKTWIPADFIHGATTAKADKDGINLSWKTVPYTEVYGTPVYTIYRDGVSVGTSYSNSFFYQFNRTAGEYPEKSDFSDSEWDFYISVSNESGKHIESDKAVYDVTAYKTWTLTAPTVTATCYEDYIKIHWTSTDNVYGNIVFGVSVNNVSVASNLIDKEYFYYLNRSVDGYPEAEDLEDYIITITASNEKGSISGTAVSIDTSYYKTWVISKPELFAVAEEKGISVNWNLTNDSYGTKKYNLYKNNVLVAQNIYANSYYEEYGEDVYPLKATLAAIKFKVKAISDGCATDSDEEFVNIDNYLGYELTKPDLYINSNSRSINLKWNKQNVYSWIGADVQVSKAYKIVDGVYTPITDDSELVWYAPALMLNPYASEENYKIGTEGGMLEVKDQNVSFSVPLYGQSTQSPINTDYAYRIRVKDAAGNSTWSDAAYIQAKATSAYDVVKAWKLNDAGERVKIDGALGVQQIFVEELSALCANIGYLNDGGDEFNYWAIGDVPLGDGEILYKGSFRVGGRDKYIKVTPIVDEHDVPTGDYDLEFKIGDLDINASGDVTINGRDFTVYDTNGDLLFEISKEDGNLIRVEEGFLKDTKGFVNEEKIDIMTSNSYVTFREMYTVVNGVQYKISLTSDYGYRYYVERETDFNVRLFIYKLDNNTLEYDLYDSFAVALMVISNSFKNFNINVYNGVLYYSYFLEQNGTHTIYHKNYDISNKTFGGGSDVFITNENVYLVGFDNNVVVYMTVQDSSNPAFYVSVLTGTGLSSRQNIYTINNSDLFISGQIFYCICVYGDYLYIAGLGNGTIGIPLFRISLADVTDIKYIYLPFSLNVLEELDFIYATTMTNIVNQDMDNLLQNSMFKITEDGKAQFFIKKGKLIMSVQDSGIEDIEEVIFEIDLTQLSESKWYNIGESAGFQEVDMYESNTKYSLSLPLSFDKKSDDFITVGLKYFVNTEEENVNIIRVRRN